MDDEGRDGAGQTTRGNVNGESECKGNDEECKCIRRDVRDGRVDRCCPVDIAHHECKDDGPCHRPYALRRDAAPWHGGRGEGGQARGTHADEGSVADMRRALYGTVRASDGPWPRWHDRGDGDGDGGGGGCP